MTKVKDAEVCDATMFDSSTTAGNIQILPLIFLNTIVCY